jgi:competence protein ComEC
MLLALLGAWLLALLGVALRARLLALLALIAVYVPVAGAGPSIQRAGIMGAAGVVAMLAGRPRWRWYAVLLAALLTLLLNPRSIGDPGWQLSFAAVIGILLFAGRVRDVVLALGSRRRPGDRAERIAADASPRAARRALAEGAGVTIAATLATAPLFAHHFGAVSLASLPANLLALPAIPPLMWLGMLAAMLWAAPGRSGRAAQLAGGPPRRLRGAGRPLAGDPGMGAGGILAVRLAGRRGGLRRALGGDGGRSRLGDAARGGARPARRLARPGGRGHRRARRQRAGRNRAGRRRP